MTRAPSHAIQRVSQAWELVETPPREPFTVDGITIAGPRLFFQSTFVNGLMWHVRFG
ncbi:uncharacterized protein PHALS_01214 [Plasmopara halstedii]|uniref:Uncharacterized protein n=1 Tax=Plasmopara halstedii TaxID=4781 RepID=A0A0P1ASE6_PLAHL|nr:uncharacterized protein PHALS_01214 [Plasmopara halstedii]CEG44884.1 hypothetical protein PHALS_01214 [Plasmopara halstedii]|eukprot:XP_024581253.1 hypothetical protein PHALS_01214 [Plasmopara halstedii]